MKRLTLLGIVLGLILQSCGKPSKLEIQPSWNTLKSLSVYKSLYDYPGQVEKVHLLPAVGIQLITLKREGACKIR